MLRPFLTAEWRHLVVLNYEIDPEIIRPLVPRGVELDAWHGRHYVSVVGFLFRNTRVRGMPIPWHRHFEEVNLRFYVTRHEGGELRRGVVFIREVAPRWAVCAVARRVYNEQYLCCPMEHELKNTPDQGRWCYRWRGACGQIEAGVEFASEPRAIQAGSEAEFILEHYWGYTRQRDGSTIEYRVEHPPWRAGDVKASWLTGDAAGFYGREYANLFAKPPISAFVADGSPVAVYPGRRLLNE